jgi:hypothetical protein
MQNPFEHPAFNMASLTNNINNLPNMYGRCNELGLFPGKGVRTRTIIVDEKNGVLTLLPTMPPGSPGTMNKMGKRKVRSFVVPHIPHDDSILPQEYEGIRAFGSETELSSVAVVMADHLQSMRNKHAITLEHLRMGALKGVILDADGSTIYNLFTEFGIQQKSIDFKLGTTTTDVRGKCMEVLRHIEKNLMGEVMSGVRALVSPEFFDKLTSHESVKEAYDNYAAAAQMLGGDLRKGFSHGGIFWEEYLGEASDMDGNTRRFIAANDGHAFPMGTMSTFQTVFAPADFIETANTMGIELYAKQEPRKFDRGIDLHTQSNPLPICYRPALLVRVFSSN